MRRQAAHRADSSLKTSASVIFASFCEPTDAGLKQLVGLDAKERGHLIQIVDLDATALIQEFIQPRLVVPTVLGEGGLRFVPGCQQRADIFPNDIECPTTVLLHITGALPWGF